MEVEGTNLIRGVLTLSSIKAELKRGSRITIKENDFQNGDIQIAMKMGYLKNVSVNAAQEVHAPQAKKSEAKAKTTEKTVNVMASVKPKLKPKVTLDTNEEIVRTPTVIDTPNPEPVSSFPDPLKKSVVWNPTGDPPIKQIKEGAAVHVKGNKKSGNKNDIEFVDAAAEQNRIKSHPVLGQKEQPPQNAEVEFLG